VAATLAAFAVVVVVAQWHPLGERHGLDAYDGLLRSRMVLGVVLGFALLCLAGLPPGVMGLVAKVVALRPVVGAHAWLLTSIAVLNVVLGVAVYLRWAVRLVAATGEPDTLREPVGALTAGSVPAAPAGTSGAAIGPTGTLGSERDGEADVRTGITVPHGVALLLGLAACVVLSVLPALVASPLG